MNLGPAEIGLIVLAVMLLFGYKKLPDASRSLGRSLRIFKSEVEDLSDRDTPAPPSAGGGSRTPTPEGTRS
jgi:TatA/E family protein of Tat protein translocase